VLLFSFCPHVSEVGEAHGLVPATVLDAFSAQSKRPLRMVATHLQSWYYLRLQAVTSHVCIASRVFLAWCFIKYQEELYLYLRIDLNFPDIFLFYVFMEMHAGICKLL
jgi:hypothetical protein